MYERVPRNRPPLLQHLDDPVVSSVPHQLNMLQSILEQIYKDYINIKPKHFPDRVRSLALASPTPPLAGKSRKLWIFFSKSCFFARCVFFASCVFLQVVFFVSYVFLQVVFSCDLCFFASCVFLQRCFFLEVVFFASCGFFGSCGFVFASCVFLQVVDFFGG